MSKRVVITGIGPVSAIGIGKKYLWDAILNRKNIAKKIPELFEINHRFKSHFYVPLPQYKISDYGFAKYYDKILQPEDKMTIVSAKLALEDAGYDLSAIDKKFLCEQISEASIFLGTGFTGLETAFHSYLSHLDIKHSERCGVIDKKLRYNRMVIPAMMTNSTSAWLSIIFGIKGMASNINASCASGTVAIGQAFRNIRDGYNKISICGGVENLHESSGALMRGFDNLSALTQNEDGDPRPFTQNRSGFLFSEGGAAILILEELEHAIERKANIYAEVVDFQANMDGYNIVQIAENGKSIAKLLKSLVRDNKIDYLNAHGTGTESNDRIEAKVIKQVFGDISLQPLINTSKGILGHTIGASGALEAAITALSIKTNQIHGMNTENSLENLNLISDTRSTKITNAITTSYGFGGHNAGLLLRKWDK